jgi:hypothetical protein
LEPGIGRGVEECSYLRAIRIYARVYLCRTCNYQEEVDYKQDNKPHSTYNKNKRVDLNTYKSTFFET